MFLQNLHELGDALKFPWFRAVAVASAVLTVGVGYFLGKMAKGWSAGRKAGSVLAVGFLVGVVGPALTVVYMAERQRTQMAGFAARQMAQVQSGAVLLGIVLALGPQTPIGRKLGWGE